MNFNGAQLHLLFNHIPVVGYPFILTAMLWATLRRENEMYIFTCYASVVTGLLTIAAYVTGDDAEHVLKKLPDFPRTEIHLHEDTAFYVLILSIALTVLTLSALPPVRRVLGPLGKAKVQNPTKKIVLILCFVISGLLALTAHQGGVIRHTEIRN